MRRQALELHHLEPPDTNHLGQPTSVAAIGFVGPYGQDRLCMARIEAGEREALGQQCMGEPYRCRPALEANAGDVGGVFAYQAGDGLGLRHQRIDSRAGGVLRDRRLQAELRALAARRLLPIGTELRPRGPDGA